MFLSMRFLFTGWIIISKILLETQQFNTVSIFVQLFQADQKAIFQGKERLIFKAKLFIKLNHMYFVLISVCFFFLFEISIYLF